MKKIVFHLSFLLSILLQLSELNASGKGIITGDGVRLRKEPNGQIITKLDKGTTVEILDKSKNEDNIDGKTSPWYEIKTNNKQQGWVFGVFLSLDLTEKLEPANLQLGDNNDSRSSQTQKNVSDVVSMLPHPKIVKIDNEVKNIDKAIMDNVFVSSAGALSAAAEGIVYLDRSGKLKCIERPKIKYYYDNNEELIYSYASQKNKWGEAETKRYWDFALLRGFEGPFWEVSTSNFGIANSVFVSTETNLSNGQFQEFRNPEGAVYKSNENYSTFYKFDEYPIKNRENLMNKRKTKKIDQKVSDVRKLISDWLMYQNQCDFKKYSNLYSEGFYGIKRSIENTFCFDQEGWLIDREQMFKKPMIVTAEDIKIVPLRNGIYVSFMQGCNSGNYLDVGMREMVVNEEYSGTKIVFEGMKKSKNFKKINLSKKHDYISYRTPKIITPGVHLKDSKYIEAETEGIWIGVFEDMKGTVLRKVDVDALCIQSSLLEDRYFVNIENEQPIFLIRGLSLDPGLCLGKYSGMTGREGDDDFFTIGKNEYYLRSISIDGKPRLSISLNSNEYMLDIKYLQNVTWLGDIDRDGKLDIFLCYTDGEERGGGGGSKLYLSTFAKENELMGLVAYFYEVWG